MPTHSEPQRPAPDTVRNRAARGLPHLLVALAGACALSGAVGVGAIFAGYGAPPLVVLLVPPVLVLAVATVALWRGNAEEAS